jgi:hypothetical protein
VRGRDRRSNSPRGDGNLRERTPKGTTMPRGEATIVLRQRSCPKGSRPLKGWLAAVYVEDEKFLMTIDMESTMTMINTRPFFERFPHMRLRVPHGAFQTADSSEIKL